MLEDWIAAISDGLPWPMVHIFIPALLVLYIDSIWISLSIIYVFESVEFMFSEIPGSEYWAEDSKVDTLVSDILMGLLGFWVAYGFKRGEPESAALWYAYFQPITTSPQWYRKWSGFIHVIMAAASTIIITLGGYFNMEVPIFYQFAVFGGLYVLLALLFGYSDWALFSLLCISVITLFAILYEHTVIVSTIVVFFAILFRTFRPQLTEQKTHEAEQTPSKQLLLHEYKIDF